MTVIFYLLLFNIDTKLSASRQLFLVLLISNLYNSAFKILKLKPKTDLHISRVQYCQKIFS